MSKTVYALVALMFCAFFAEAVAITLPYTVPLSKEGTISYTGWCFLTSTPSTFIAYDYNDTLYGESTTYAQRIDYYFVIDLDEKVVFCHYFQVAPVIFLRNFLSLVHYEFPNHEVVNATGVWCNDIFEVQTLWVMR